MKREKLTGIVREAAGSEYTFYSGAAHRMNGTLRVYPAAWLEPPVLRSSAGRMEGRVTYRTTIHFMALPAAANESEVLWAKLEHDALAAVRAAASDPAVTEVTNVSCTPSQQSLTAHGEVSVTLVCDISMWYYV